MSRPEAPMENEQLVCDLLEWLGPGPRSYEDVMAAWRSSCPRLTIWEDTLAAGLLMERNRQVHITDAGRRFLERHGR